MPGMSWYDGGGLTWFPGESVPVGVADPEVTPCSISDACGDDLSAGWMASKDADGSGTPLLEPDSCLDRTCLLVSDCCLTRGCLEAGRVLPLASMVQTLLVESTSSSWSDFTGVR